MQQEATTLCHIVLMLDSCYAMGRIKDMVTAEYNRFITHLMGCRELDITTVLYGEEMKVICEKAFYSDKPRLSAAEYVTGGKSLFYDGARCAMELGDRLFASERGRHSPPERVLYIFVMYDFFEVSHCYSTTPLKEVLRQHLDGYDRSMVLFGSGKNTEELVEKMKDYSDHLINLFGIYAEKYVPDEDGVAELFNCIDNIVKHFYYKSDKIIGSDQYTSEKHFDSGINSVRQTGSVYDCRLREIYEKEAELMKSWEKSAMGYADLRYEVLPMIKFTLADEVCSVFDSKMGGLPYMPQDRGYPMKNGKALPFFAQLNLDRLRTDIIEGMPDRGMLQFFLENEKNFVVRYYERIIYDEGSVAGREDMLSAPVCRFAAKEMKLKTVGSFPCPITCDDGRLNATLCSYFNCNSQETLDDRLDYLAAGLKKKGLRVNRSICMGGYVSTAEEGSGFNNSSYEIQLFQFFDGREPGRAVHFMISREDLRLRDFDKAVVVR